MPIANISFPIAFPYPYIGEDSQRTSSADLSGKYVSRIDAACPGNFSQTDFGVLNLPVSACASQLPDNLHNLGDAGRSEGVPFCQQPAAWIHGYPPAEFNRPFIYHAAAFALFAKLQLLIV